MRIRRRVRAKDGLELPRVRLEHGVHQVAAHLASRELVVHQIEVDEDVLVHLRVIACIHAGGDDRE